MGASDTVRQLRGRIFLSSQIKAQLLVTWRRDSVAYGGAKKTGGNNQLQTNS